MTATARDIFERRLPDAVSEIESGTGRAFRDTDRRFRARAPKALALCTDIVRCPGSVTDAGKFGTGSSVRLVPKQDASIDWVTLRS